MPFFHVYLLKSREKNPAKYCRAKIAKLSTNKLAGVESGTTQAFHLVAAW